MKLFPQRQAVLKTALFVIIVFSTLSASAVLPPYLSVIEQTISQKNGIYLYDEDSNKLFFTAFNTGEDGRDIDEFNADSFPITRSPNDIPIDNNTLDYVVFDESVVIELHSQADQDGAMIRIEYNEEDNEISCTYEYDSTPGNFNTATKRQEYCNSSRVTSVTSYQISGEAVYVLDLSELCVRDTGGDLTCFDQPGQGGRWNENVSSFKVSQVGQDVDVGLPLIVSSEDTFVTQKIPLDLARRVSNLYNWVMGIGAMIALSVIIFGGVLYSASAGNSSRIGEAKTWIQRAIFGLILLFSSYLILYTINPDLTQLEDVFLEKSVRVGTSGIDLIGSGQGGSCPIKGAYQQSVPSGSSFFDCREPVGVGSENCSRLHLGIDILDATSNPSPPLVAVESGIAYDSSDMHLENPICGFGVRILGEKSGIYYSYCHLAGPPIVSSGTHVEKGQAIGTMGTTGNSNTIHLHFGAGKSPYNVPELKYDPCSFLQTVCTASGPITCKDRSNYGLGSVPGF